MMPAPETMCSLVIRWAARSHNWSPAPAPPVSAGSSWWDQDRPRPGRRSPPSTGNSSHAYDSEESTAQARDDILTARALSDELKAQIVTDSRSSADAARTEWPLRGIAQDISERTQMVDVPTLVIAGENDHVEPAQILQQNLIPYLPGAELMVIPSTGHLIPLEAPTELANAISDFSPAT
jgi:pimeloyl-ACP methyl ester carboxylesterase